MLDVIFLMSMVIYITGNPAVNIALHKPTCMSSLYGHYFSSFAVDGNMGAHIEDDGCTHTSANDSTPWLMVDLQRTYLVNNVALTNRNVCWDRLHSFVIEIFEKNSQRCVGAISGVCVNYTGDPLGEGENRTFTCETPVRGRFVRIMKWKKNSKDDVLTLCEVQIFGNISTRCGNSYTIQRVDNTRLRSDHVELTTDLTPIECAVKCERKPSCLAFNFNVNTKECELIFNPMFNATKESQPAWGYYGSDLC